MAINPAPLPELVRDFKLEATTFQGDLTIHTQPLGRRRRIEKWKRGEMLGHGGYGVVWLEHKLGSDDAAGPVCRAVKVVRNHGRGPMHYGRELEALAKFSQEKYSDFFVKFLGWYENPEADYLHIAMEYCPYGDLKKYLAKKGGKLPENEVRDIASQVLAGVVMMHRAGFANRDIKPANILIKSMPPGDWWVKICDFGLSKRAEGGIASTTTTVKGTPKFMPPEMLGCYGDPRKVNWFMVDMWCLGETIFQALTGKSVFEIPADVGRYVEGSLEFPVRVLNEVNASTQAKFFISALMRARPSYRITSEVAIRHHWMQDMTLEGAIRASEAQSMATQGRETSYQHTLPRPKAPDDQLTQASGQWTTTMTFPNKPPRQQQRRFRPHNLQPISESQPMRSHHHSPTGSAAYPALLSPGYLEGNHSPLNHNAGASLDSAVAHTDPPIIRPGRPAMEFVRRKNSTINAGKYPTPSHLKTRTSRLRENRGYDKYLDPSYEAPLAWHLPSNDERTVVAPGQPVEPTEVTRSSNEEEAIQERMKASARPMAEEQWQGSQQKAEGGTILRKLKKCASALGLSPPFNFRKLA